MLNNVSARAFFYDLCWRALPAREKSYPASCSASRETSGICFPLAQYSREEIRPAGERGISYCVWSQEVQPISTGQELHYLLRSCLLSVYLIKLALNLFSLHPSLAEVRPCITYHLTEMHMSVLPDCLLVKKDKHGLCGSSSAASYNYNNCCKSNREHATDHYDQTRPTCTP